MQGTGLWHDDELVFSHPLADEDKALDALVFKVRRNPKNLKAHLRRIYFCYQKCLAAQLYAALLDFVIILQGKGRAICCRMIAGSRSQLDSQQIAALNKSMENENYRQGNRFSLFTSGLVGKCDLVEYRRQDKVNHDFLTLANDFIEYSQLEQAMDVLENGVIVNPERQDLQEALLELYQSTRNRTRFENFYKTCVAANVPLVNEWRLTANFFEGQA
ncbi:MAG: type IV pilus assembly protein FimV [Methylomonas sp.]